MEQLTAARLARLVGCRETQLQELQQLGILGPADEGYTNADVEKVRLVLALDKAGVEFSVLSDAVATGGLSLDFAGQLMFEPAYLSGALVEDELKRQELSSDLVSHLRRAAGLPEFQPGQMLRDDDVEILTIFAKAKAAGISERSLARVLRVFGQNARRVSETMRDLFREQVEDRLLADGLSRRDMLNRAAEQRLGLQRLGFRTLFLLQRRLLEELVFDNVVSRVQESFLDAGQAGLLSREPKSVAFVDITGFTALTQEHGDEHAAECAARLEAIAYDAATQNGGHPIKSLGDGVMMLFPGPAAAVEGCLKLMDSTRSHQLPALAAGIATGPVVPRDGDVFGVTVNLAARIAAEASGSQLLVCPDTRTALLRAATDNLLVQQPTSMMFKGFKEPVVVSIVKRAS